MRVESRRDQRDGLYMERSGNVRKVNDISNLKHGNPAMGLSRLGEFILNVKDQAR